MDEKAWEGFAAHMTSLSVKRRRELVAMGLKLAYDDAVRTLEAKAARVAPELDPVETVRRILERAEKHDPD